MLIDVNNTILNDTKYIYASKKERIIMAINQIHTEYEVIYKQ